MTATSIDIDVSSAAAAAILRCLPAAEVTAGAPLSGNEGLAAATPALGSRAVVAALTGSVSGSLVVVLSPELATAIENGPVGPQELTSALETGIADAAGALGQSFGEVRYETIQALDAEVALANASDNEQVSVVPFNQADGSTVASIAILIAAPDAAAAFESLSESIGSASSHRAVELLSDVEMGVTVELGRTRMTVRELLSMQPGSVVELDRAAGSPVDLLVNGTLVARGEVVVIDEEFGVRITEIIGYDNKKGPSA
jgi:flagellar motor switch protein FliN